VISVLLALVTAVTPGERLEYDVRYGPITVGSLVLETLAPDSIDSVPCYHFRADLELTRSVSWLFWANYRLESWCRTSDFVTLRSYKRTREPRYKSAWTARYMPEAGRAYYTDGKSFALPDSARDMLTLWYYLRFLTIDKGETLRVNVHDAGKDYRLAATTGAAKRVSVPAGVYDCIAVIPRAGTPLGSVCLSDDDERLPVVLRTRISGLAVSAYLRRVAGEEE
jgi:hypothetical protein